MTTALSLITSSMRKIGALTKDETPSSDEANAGLEMLNDLLASLSNESMCIYANTLENFTLAANDGEYTIGSGGNFNTTRPIKIVSAYVRSGGIDYPVIQKTDEDFARISFKTQAGIPEYLNYNNAYPLATLKLHPLPAQADTLFLVTEKELTSFASLATDVSLPPGWKRMLIYNLSPEMGPEYGIEVGPQIIRIAQDSKAAIQRAIIKNKSMDVPSNLENRHNIYAGWS